jgi:N-acetyl-anhydromuramyl-L-alanine amidase AmpD
MNGDIIVPEAIIIHHSLTKDSDTVSWSAIRRFHLSNGWSDIGYHFGIEKVNETYEVLMGRMPNKKGAHCKEQGMNSKSIGVCFVGNYDIEVPPPEVWTMGIRLVRWLMGEFEIKWQEVYGHTEFATHKSCPGKMFDMDLFRAHLVDYTVKV